MGLCMGKNGRNRRLMRLRFICMWQVWIPSGPIDRRYVGGGGTVAEHEEDNLGSAWID
jgi:hypothetical protein